MAHLTVTSHEYTKVVTTATAYGAESFQPVSHRETTVETVRVRFEIHGGEPFAKKHRSVNKIRPEALHITYCSVDGGAWRADYGVTMTGSNIKKDGSLGAESEVHYLDFPQWLTALYKPDKADDRSETLDWVRAEYPR